MAKQSAIDKAIEALLDDRDKHLAEAEMLNHAIERLRAQRQAKPVKARKASKPPAPAPKE